MQAMPLIVFNSDDPNGYVLPHLTNRYIREDLFDSEVNDSNAIDQVISPY